MRLEGQSVGLRGQLYRRSSLASLAWAHQRKVRPQQTGCRKSVERQPDGMGLRAGRCTEPCTAEVVYSVDFYG
jgi:hypothetical protein